MVDTINCAIRQEGDEATDGAEHPHRCVVTWFRCSLTVSYSFSTGVGFQLQTQREGGTISGSPNRPLNLETLKDREAPFQYYSNTIYVHRILSCDVSDPSSTHIPMLGTSLIHGALPNYPSVPLCSKNLEHRTAAAGLEDSGSGTNA